MSHSHSSNRSIDWLRQADNDLKFAKSAAREGFYAQCCFISQQSAEKALKAILFFRGTKLVMTHSLLKLCEALAINGKLREAAGHLDQYYLSGRYPDALPGGAPFEVFTPAQAKRAIRDAQTFLRTAKKLMTS